MYQVIVEKHALKQLAELPLKQKNKIAETLRSLAINPRPHGYLKLKGRSGCRIRVGDYRIIYEINDGILLVLVIAIGNRRDVYE